MEYRKDCQFKRYDVDDVITFCHANYKYFMMSQTRHWSKWKGLVMKNRKLPSACTRNWKKQHTLFLQHFPFDKNDFHTYLYTVWWTSQLQLLYTATVVALTRWASEAYVAFMQYNFFIIGILVDFNAFLWHLGNE